MPGPVEAVPALFFHTSCHHSPGKVEGRTHNESLQDRSHKAVRSRRWTRRIRSHPSSKAVSSSYNFQDKTGIRDDRCTTADLREPRIFARIAASCTGPLSSECICQQYKRMSHSIVVSSIVFPHRSRGMSPWCAGAGRWDRGCGPRTSKLEFTETQNIILVRLSNFRDQE